MASAIREYFGRISKNYSAFFKGMGSLNIWGYYSKPTWMNNNLTPEEQDELAIRKDWEEVENDFRISMGKSKKSLFSRL